MSTSSASPSATAPVVPVVRYTTFDPLKHASCFLLDRLHLTASKRGGHPQLVLDAMTPDGLARAGLITHIPERPATLGSDRLPPSIALSGRIAEYSDAQRHHLLAAGGVFKAQPGERKMFWTAYVAEAAIPAFTQALQALKTVNGRTCLMGQFAARAMVLFQQRHAELRHDEEHLLP